MYDSYINENQVQIFPAKEYIYFYKEYKFVIFEMIGKCFTLHYANRHL